jgi:hypothetical protein
MDNRFTIEGAIMENLNYLEIAQHAHRMQASEVRRLFRLAFQSLFPRLRDSANRNDELAFSRG